MNFLLSQASNASLSRAAILFHVHKNPENMEKYDICKIMY